MAPFKGNQTTGRAGSVERSTCDMILSAISAMRASLLRFGSRAAGPAPRPSRIAPTPKPLLAIRPEGATQGEQTALDRLAQQLDDLIETDFARLDAGEAVADILNDPQRIDRKDRLLAERKAIIDAVANRQA